ncbi:MAG TPA: hypothetical protein VFY66_08035, partial [Anaerolineales bacterium]|nr:hypothetical protein [Anaerolineales bacterium]
MNITHVRMATEHLDMWESLIGSRKSPLKQASLIGFGTLFALFMRRLTLEDAVRRVYERIGVKGRAIIWPHAEPCMDVDKPSQLELLRADLARQQSEAVSKPRKTVRKPATRSAKPKATAKTVRVKKRVNGSKKSPAVKTSKNKLKEEN